MIDDLLKLTPRPPGEDAAERAGSARPAQVKIGAGAQVVDDFRKLYHEQLAGLVDVTTHSDRLDRAFAAGKTDNIHEVMVAAAQSSLALETAMQVRNIAVRAFQTLTQLR